MKAKPSLSTKRDFYNMIGFYSDSNLDIITSLTLLREDLKNLDVMAMIEKLRNGDPPVKVFAESGLTDEFIAATLEIGEKTENYKMAYKTSCGYLEEKSRSRNNLGKLIFYPSLLICMMFFLLIFIAGFAVPQIYKVYMSMDVEIPLAVAMIMDINGFLSGNTTAIKMAVLALTAAIIIMPDKSRAVRAIYSRILRIRWARRIYSAHYVNEISWQVHILMEAGKDAVESFEIIRNSIGDRYMRLVIEDIILNLKNGVRLSEALSRNPEVFGPAVITYIKTGEESGRLTENIAYVHKYTKRRLEDLTERFSRMIQPAAIMIIGLFLAGILAVLMPLLDVSSLYSAM